MRRLFAAAGFDYNGTILNDPRNFYRAIAALFVSYSLDPPSFKECHDGWQGNGIELFCREGGIHESLESLQKFFDEWFARHKHSKLQPGVWRVLQQLKKDAIPTGLLSGLRSDVLVDEMRRHNLFQFFLLVRGGLDGKTPSIIESCALFECRPSEFVYIGDSARDVADGKAAGCFTVGYLRGYGSPQSLRDAEPDLLIKEWKELRKYIQFRGQ